MLANVNHRVLRVMRDHRVFSDLGGSGDLNSGPARVRTGHPKARSEVPAPPSVRAGSYLVVSREIPIASGIR